MIIVSRRSKKILLVGLAILIFALVVVFGDWPRRYSHWNSLTKETVIQRAGEYAEQQFGGGATCIYSVDCSSGRARLSLIHDIDSWDIEETKEITWQRRFSDFCPGRTTNIGLQVIPFREGPWTDSTILARWSFRYDGFIPRMGRFQSGSFSEDPEWEKCSPAFAVDLDDAIE